MQPMSNFFGSFDSLVTVCRLDQQGGQKICQQEVSKVICSHVQLQTVLCKVLLGQSKTGVKDQDIQSGKSRRERGDKKNLRRLRRRKEFDTKLGLFR